MTRQRSASVGQARAAAGAYYSALVHPRPLHEKSILPAIDVARTSPYVFAAVTARTGSPGMYSPPPVGPLKRPIASSSSASQTDRRNGGVTAPSADGGTAAPTDLDHASLKRSMAVRGAPHSRGRSIGDSTTYAPQSSQSSRPRAASFSNAQPNGLGSSVAVQNAAHGRDRSFNAFTARAPLASHPVRPRAASCSEAQSTALKRAVAVKGAPRAHDRILRPQEDHKAAPMPSMRYPGYHCDHTADSGVVDYKANPPQVYHKCKPDQDYRDSLGVTPRYHGTTSTQMVRFATTPTVRDPVAARSVYKQTPAHRANMARSVRRMTTTDSGSEKPAGYEWVDVPLYEPPRRHAPPARPHEMREQVEREWAYGYRAALRLNPQTGRSEVQMIPRSPYDADDHPSAFWSCLKWFCR